MEACELVPRQVHRTARAVIRDEALRLFAARGPDAVTVRQIAAAAGVSPALVVHHFGSKEGLREVIDEHVLGLFEAMLGEMTADGHLRYFAAACRLPALDRAEELVGQLGYTRLRREPAGTLSGGTRQKLNLTLALMHDPDVLLLDEPYQGFDWETYLRFWDLVTDLRARRKAIVIITHLVFEQDRFDLLADLSGGQAHPPRAVGEG